jgi:L,D-transpeptidase catalytic domain
LIRAAIAVAGWLALSPPGALAGRAGSTPVAHSQQLVAVFSTHVAHRRPDSTSRVVDVVRSTTPITGARTTLPVLGRVVDGHGRGWLRVRLPGRALTGQRPPSSGWIRTVRTLRPTSAWHILVDRGLRRVTVYHSGRAVRSYPAIVGKPATPTPRGEYFVEENVRLSAGQSGAPFALATSARSAVLQEFDGGPGQIALHGLGGVGGRLGTAVSHGCVRLSDRAITWLAARIGPGVPVTIL